MGQLGAERRGLMKYQRVLRLPCDDIRSGIGFKATLDKALRQLLEGLFKAADGFRIEFGDHTGGHLRAIITRGPQKIEVEGCYGQNSSFAEGKKVQFVSYTVHVEGGFGGQRSENATENAETIGKIVGVVLSVMLVCAILSPLLRKSGKFMLLLPVLAVLVYGGKVFGARVGRTLASGTSGGGSQEGVSGNEKGQVDAVWKRLIHAIESVTEQYPTA